MATRWPASTRGLTRKRQPLLKSVFKGAAMTVIQQLPNDPLHAHYQRMVDKGIKPTLARFDAGAAHCVDGALDVEAPGGVRPATARFGRSAVERLAREARAAGSTSTVAARERFEGEHPLVSWSPGRDGKTQVAGYAPSECRLKPWPNKALSGAWRARSAGQRTEGFEVERVEVGRSLPVVVVGEPLIGPFAWCDASRTSALEYANIRPLRDLPCGRLGGVLS